MTSLVTTGPTAPPRAPERREPQARGRALELQGFRGLAALSTVVFHVWQQY